MERWPSWSKAHDWKSCIPHKGIEGSNPSLSATSERTHRSYLWVFHLCQWVDQRKKNNIPSCAEVANELVVDRDTLLDDAVFLCGLVNLHIVDQGRHDMSVRFFNVRVLPPQTGA